MPVVIEPQGEIAAAELPEASEEIAIEEVPTEVIAQVEPIMPTPEPVAISAKAKSNVKELEIKRALDVAVVAAERIKNRKIQVEKSVEQEEEIYSYNINLGFISWSGTKSVSE